MNSCTSASLQSGARRIGSRSFDLVATANQVGRVFSRSGRPRRHHRPPRGEYMLGIEATMHLSGPRAAGAPALPTARRIARRRSSARSCRTPARCPGPASRPGRGSGGSPGALRRPPAGRRTPRRRECPAPGSARCCGTRGRRSARPADGAGCGSGGCSGASGSRRSRPGRGGRRCSATPLGIRFVHGVRLQGPQGVEAVQTVALEQVVVLRGGNGSFAPLEKATTWRIRFLSGFVQVPATAMYR